MFAKLLRERHILDHLGFHAGVSANQSILLSREGDHRPKQPEIDLAGQRASVGRDLNEVEEERKLLMPPFGRMIRLNGDRAINTMCADDSA